MRLQDLIHLGRPVDLGYPTNRAIVILSALCAVGITVWRVVSGDALPAAGAEGGTGAVAVFLGWALARELDPDGERAAFVGAGLTVVAIVAMPRSPDIAALFWMLLSLRVANRTTGAPSTALDTLLVIGLTAYGAFQGHALVGGIAAVAFAVDGLERGAVPRHRWFAVLAFGLAVAGHLSAPREAAFVPFDSWALIAASLATIAFLARVVVPGAPRSRGDVDGLPLDRTRLVAAQAIALATAWGFLVVEGADGLAAVVPLWGAIAGAAAGPRS